jgi:beta-mannosidase
MRAHQKHPIGNETIDEYMRRWYPEPKDFESFVYVSQVLQAEGMRVGISAHRQAMPYSMGTLYWQFNDCWPVASWSSVDFYGNWKALHYYARKAYSNIYLAPVSENDRFLLYLVSDLQESSDAMLNVTVYDFKGEVKNQMQKNVTVKTNSHLVVDLPVTEILNGAPKESSVLIATLTRNGEILAANHHYFELPKNLHLEKPSISFATRKVADGYEVTLETDFVARNVYLYFPETQGWWTDNFFELIPGHTKTVVFETSATISNPADLLQVRSLADAF